MKSLSFRLAAAWLAVSLSPALLAQSSESLFRGRCANCHSRPIRGDLAEVDMIRVIRDGRPARGMPAFGESFDDVQMASLVRWIRTGAQHERRVVGTRIDAEGLDVGRSANYHISDAQTVPGVRHVGYFDHDSIICYANVDLTGVRSLDLQYARGDNGEPGGRIAVLIAGEDGLGARENLGEKVMPLTGGWETYGHVQVGLSRAVTGRRLLCFFGLAGGGIMNLDHFTLRAEAATNDGITRRFPRPELRFVVDGNAFRLERVVEAPGEIWAFAFLPDRSMIATQKNGDLWLIRDGKLMGPVRGTPRVWNRGEGGLLDVELHPGYARNGWIYLAYADPDPAGNAMTAIVRARVDSLEWRDQETIYQAPANAYSGVNSHFGARIALDGGFVYFGFGERVEEKLAQDLAAPHGKIHRLHDDGRVPGDNPFVGNERALPSIWTYGHRNPQGLAFQRPGGLLWSSEHGPQGGDELNVVRRGRNYGWPLVSFGTHYDGTPYGASPLRDDIEPPARHWTPSLGISQIAFYEGEKFPAWRGALLVASLGRQELHLVRTAGPTVTADQVLLSGVGRIRDVVSGPDGHPYAAINNPNGTIYRIVPSK
jgi:aldose sugar dehydrogenase